MKKLTILILIFAALCTANAQTPAFPGAYGGGMYTSGGRGGKVLYVTSLEDGETRDVGTFRWAVSQHYPRTVVFKVSGIIQLKRKLSIKQGDLTIAGQTAPGDGICIAGHEVTIGADNVIIRYLRFRPGFNEADGPADATDAINGRGCTNVIIDHCSMSWCVDECASFYYNKNFTMQWCFITESLQNAGHSKGAHGYGGIWGGENASFHHNLIANHDSRNPRLNGWTRHGLKWKAYPNVTEERCDIRNNVIFNWGKNSCYGGEMNGQYNIVGNYMRAGMGTDPKKTDRLMQIDIETEQWPDSIESDGYGKFYIADNFLWDALDQMGDDWTYVATKSNKVRKNKAKVNEPFACTPVPTHNAKQLPMLIAAYGGCNLPVRDRVDQRIAQEVMTGRSNFKGSVGGRWGIIDKPSDVGGYPEYKTLPAKPDTNEDGIPDEYEAMFIPAGKVATDIAEDGYSYLEHYLNALVAETTDAEYAGANF